MTRAIEYKFDFEDGNQWNYVLQFDEFGQIVSQESCGEKEWTKLNFHKCSHCPLSSEQHPQCPVARNLEIVVEDSKNEISCKNADVTVSTGERTYSKTCQTQEGLHSLLGLIMASSACPHLDWLRPLARFHLPFVRLEESLFRILSLQLLSQYFLDPKSSVSECATGVQEKYSNVEKVNHAFIERIRAYCDGDADKNAIASLDVFVQLFQYQLAADFSDLRKLFHSED